MALDSCKISYLKSKSGGGGLIETSEAQWVNFVVRTSGFFDKIGNGSFSIVSMMHIHG